MISDSIENGPAAPEAEQPRPKRKPSKRAKTAKKAQPAMALKSKADRSMKKTAVIALLKRAKGATLGEITKATGWQPHRGFVSILGSKGGEKIESSNLPLWVPRSCAYRMPDKTLSRITPRSNSAIAAIIVNMALPMGVQVSSAS